MVTNLKPFQSYSHAIEKTLAADDAAEHTPHPALKSLLESMDTAVTATTEPTHIECGAPDFIVRKRKGRVIVSSFSFVIAST